MSELNKLGIAPFDASDYLDNEETIAEYLTAALENPDPDAGSCFPRGVAEWQKGHNTVRDCVCP